MREHLYQGKGLDDGKWVEGNLIHRTDYYGDPVDDYFIVEEGPFDYNSYYAHEVDHDTVREFTGVWEKNGKKSKRIFEGDIVLAVYRNGRGRKANKYIGVVEFGEFQDYVGSKYTGFYIKWKHYVRSSLLWWRDSHNTSLEVIGNKWDNPELLEKSE